MKEFYVVGNPISQSISPLIFKYWFNKYKIKSFYKKKQLSKKSFEKQFKNLIETKKCLGANITVPFKKRVEKIVDRQTKAAKEIGAINCVYKKNNQTIGTNTDWRGFIKSVKHQNKNITTNTAAIIGFGGATLAIIYALKKMGFKKIDIFVRDIKKTKGCFKKTKQISFYNINKINKKAKNFNLLINTTTTSSVKKLKINLSKLTSHCVVVDINYKPHETNLIKCAKKEKRKISYGLYMLLFQATPTFYHWFGFYPKVDNKLIEVCKKRLSK